MTDVRAPRSLAARYAPDDLRLFDDAERARFLGPLGADGDAALAGDRLAFRRIARRVAWELLYRKEPELWEQPVAGEQLHPSVLDRVPGAERAVEIAAGGGRLTLEVAGRCRELVAVEPVRAFRDVLARKLEAAGISNVDIVHGFFDAVPLPDESCELVVSCSAFTSDPAHGGDPGLEKMDRILVRGGMIALVWPSDVDWLRERGFTYESFDGEMCIDFGSLDEAVRLARIVYPSAVDAIVERGSARVPYDVVGMNAPRDIAWRCRS